MSAIPKHRIPKIIPICPSCDGTDCSTVMSQPFAEGYHRRHICNGCGSAFYTLAKYDKTGYARQVVPFKDRPLLPWEEREREAWQAEATTVTIESNSGTELASEFLETVNEILLKHQRQEALTEREAEIVIAIEQLEKEYHA